ncbi:LemA family [Mycoplasmopsis maculosa]|uniref:LemA family n=1 Tax=Mycoplasmopsis maculosa TaxID=114885 RepID=A0A449B4U2_9BACT|nr:LemA family protein [Mycoplasmopsis maculosa]VEU75548.1 LemA family [Mycoplasmopsis maculosa]
MANELDELTGPVNSEGKDINVIQKQIPVKVGAGSLIFEIFLWILIIPGLIFLFVKIKSRNYLRQLQQKINHNASTVDNFLEQRVQILQNAASIMNKAIEFDKSVMTEIAALRSGATASNDFTRSEINTKLNSAFDGIKVQIERYPELQAHDSLKRAMQENSYLQKEITAAREIYNDTVLQWNQEIFNWPSKQIVAAKAGYTTRIPFSVSFETKEKARSNFFE